MYKCFNFKCGSCIGKSFCGEPADTALGCASRLVSDCSNADRTPCGEERVELIELIEESRITEKDGGIRINSSAGIADHLIANDVKVQKHGRWSKGAIISGYQGIGKSTLANNSSGYIDLESGNFFVNGKRGDDWYIVYSQIAVHLAEQGYRVFVSSHAVVREYLASLPKTVDLFVCFPSYSLRRQWVKKLEERYMSSQKDKDYRAWKNAEDRYAENIKELHEAKGFRPIVIHDMGYDLARLIDNYSCPNCGALMDLPIPPKGEQV